MAEGIIKSEIKTACDILRSDDGTSGVTDYMEQLSWLLFLRVFEGIEEELEENANLDGKQYIKIIDKKFRWSNWAHRDWIGKPKDSLHNYVDNVEDEFKKIINPENTLIHFVDNILFPYLRSLSGTPEKDKINQIFTEISGNKMKSTYNFLDVIEKIDKINPNNYEDTHILSQFYELLLLEMGNEAGWSGEFYTPRPVVEFIVEFIKPKFGQKIFDPFGGSGGFLVESFKFIKDTIGEGITIQENEILQRETFYGQDKKPLPYLCGTMNLILHGLINPNFYRKNTLMEDIYNVLDDDKYDLILTNPPFGGKENKNVQNNYIYKTSETAALALQYIMKKLKYNGRAGIILPEGQLFFGTGTFKNIRKELLEKFNVFAIISLPKGVFTSMGTGVKTNVLFFEKTGSPTKDIWYYEIDGKFSKTAPIKKKNFIDALDKAHNREISINSWLVTLEEIKDKDYKLNSRNPNKKNEYEYIDPISILSEIESLEDDIDNTIKDIKGLLK